MGISLACAILIPVKVILERLALTSCIYGGYIN